MQGWRICHLLFLVTTLPPIPFHVICHNQHQAICTTHQHTHTQTYTGTRININILIIPKFTSTVTESTTTHIQRPHKTVLMNLMYTATYKPSGYTTLLWILDGLIKRGAYIQGDYKQH